MFSILSLPTRKEGQVRPIASVLLFACALGTTFPLFANAGEAPAAGQPVVRQVNAPVPEVQTQQSRTTAPIRESIGDITRALLAAQADGRRAGSDLPILGDVASASYQRYLDSFTHPIPEFFQERLEKSTGR